MEEAVLEALQEPEVTPEHLALLQHCKQLSSFSRRHMSIYYPKWDKYDMIYRGYKYRDDEDRKAADRNEPEKMVVPLTFAQINTFVAFCYTLYTQRPYFFEMVGTAGEDASAADIAEAVLERDLNTSNFRGAILINALRDIAKFGVGIIKHGWVKETQMQPVETTIPPLNFLGMTVGEPTTVTSIEPVTKFLGNRLYNISPYRFFPDVRLPLTRFQEGEFCASEDEYAYTALKQMEKDGLIAGLDFVKDMSTGVGTGIPEDRRLFLSNLAGRTEAKLTGSQTKGMYLITEVQVKIVPNQFKFGGKVLGEEDYPIMHIVWIANDQRIIRVERMNYLHNQFTYDVGQFDPDITLLVNGGVADALEALQDTVTWFINAHIMSVRKVISNYLIVDPTGIEMKDLSDRKPVIRLKSSAARSGVDRWVRQLAVQDVTQKHMADAETLKGLAQETTGITENLMGQYAKGRRSASESRSVNQGAAGRVQMVASQIWWSMFKPMGEKLLSNLRDGLDEQTLIRVLGQSAMPQPQLDPNTGQPATDPQTGQPVTQPPPDVTKFLDVDKADLVGNYDFVVFDGTLPSEKQSIAQALQEILQTILTNPEAARIFGIDAKKLLKKIMELKGIKNLDDYDLPPEMVQQMWNFAYGQLMPPPPQPPGVHQPGQKPNDPQQHPVNAAQQNAQQHQNASAGQPPQSNPGG